MSFFCSLCQRRRLPLQRVNPISFLRQLSTSVPLCEKFEWNNRVEDYVKRLVRKHNHLNKRIGDTEGDLSHSELKDFAKEIKKLKPVVESFKVLQSKRNDILEVQELSRENHELKDLVREEIALYEEEINQLEASLLDIIIPKDEDDVNNAILEVRSGEGGRDASIFALEIFSMYSVFARKQGWKFYTVSKADHADGFGVTTAVASIVGRNVYGNLKHEVGVHCVQRSEKTTEKQGRMHTAYVTVMVLSQPKDINTVVNMKDVKVDTFRQSVDTTFSAVRMTHIPTGIVAACQEERSQFVNREIALRVLTARIHEQEKRRQDRELSDERKSQVDSLMAGKIRTCNFQYGRVTDHRIKETVFSLEDFLSGGDSLGDFVQKLKMHEKLNALANVA